MASKILLVSVNQCDAPYPVFPLGLAHLAAALHQAGHETEWVDAMAGSPTLDEALGTFQPGLVGLSLRNIDDVLIKRRETYFTPVRDLCQQIRGVSPARVVLGGSGFSIFPVQLLGLTGADFGIQGEGEASLVALVDALEHGRPYGSIPGLVFRENGRILANPQSRGLAPGQVPLALRPDALVSYYLDRSAMLNLQTQRGCAFDCCYCTYPLIEGKTYRYRAPEAVADEFAAVRAQGGRYVFIVDSVFNSSAEHVAAVCEALLRRDLKLQWGCFLRPKGLSPDLMRLMARAGLSHIEFGTDSFCDSVLEAYGKRFTFEDVLHSSNLARENRVDYCHFLVCGGPGEDEGTLRAAYRNSLRLDGAVNMALVGMRIYPGTPLFDQLRAGGGLTDTVDLLQPQYYLSPAISEERVFALLREFSAMSPNWIVGDPPAAYLQMAERLRARGILGPLWGYLALMQRLAVPVPGPAA